MSPAILEHINITVLDPESYAAKLCKIFDWHIRWSGSSMDNGHTVHIGSKDSYIALYTNNTSADKIRSSSSAYSELNHIAMTVEDLDAVEAKVIAAGYEPHNHGDYEPGRRFYFHDENGLEYEVVSYLSQKQIKRKQILKQLGTMSRNGALMR